MADKFENFAPYAPASAVERALDQHHDRGLPNPVTLVALERIGVPTTMTSRTHQALRFLGFVDESGNHLPAFDRLRRATSEEYPSQLADVLQAAYLSVLTSVDPATADDIRLTDAFRGFEPSLQRPKMIALFRALCAKAGLIENTPRRRGPARRGTQPATAGPKPPTVNPPPKPLEEQPPYDPPPHRPDYRVVSAIFEQLPANARWSSARRDRWIQAMTAAVDLLIEVGDEVSSGREPVMEQAAGSPNGSGGVLQDSRD